MFDPKYADSKQYCWNKEYKRAEEYNPNFHPNLQMPDDVQGHAQNMVNSRFVHSTKCNENYVPEPTPDGQHKFDRFDISSNESLSQSTTGGAQRQGRTTELKTDRTRYRSVSRARRRSKSRARCLEASNLASITSRYPNYPDTSHLSAQSYIVPEGPKLHRLQKSNRNIPLRSPPLVNVDRTAQHEECTNYGVVGDGAIAGAQNAPSAPILNTKIHDRMANCIAAPFNSKSVRNTEIMPSDSSLGNPLRFRNLHHTKSNPATNYNDHRVRRSKSKMPCISKSDPLSTNLGVAPKCQYPLPPKHPICGDNQGLDVNERNTPEDLHIRPSTKNANNSQLQLHGNIENQYHRFFDQNTIEGLQNMRPTGLFNEMHPYIDNEVEMELCELALYPSNAHQNEILANGKTGNRTSSGDLPGMHLDGNGIAGNLYPTTKHHPFSNSPTVHDWSRVNAWRLEVSKQNSISKIQDEISPEVVEKMPFTGTSTEVKEVVGEGSRQKRLQRSLERSPEKIPLTDRSGGKRQDEAHREGMQKLTNERAAMETPVKVYSGMVAKSTKSNHAEGVSSKTLNKAKQLNTLQAQDDGKVEVRRKLKQRKPFVNVPNVLLRAYSLMLERQHKNLAQLKPFGGAKYYRLMTERKQTIGFVVEKTDCFYRYWSSNDRPYSLTFLSFDGSPFMHVVADTNHWFNCEKIDIEIPPGNLAYQIRKPWSLATYPLYIETPAGRREWKVIKAPWKYRQREQDIYHITTLDADPDDLPIAVTTRRSLISDSMEVISGISFNTPDMDANLKAATVAVLFHIHFRYYER